MPTQKNTMETLITILKAFFEHKSSYIIRDQVISAYYLSIPNQENNVPLEASDIQALQNLDILSINKETVTLNETVDQVIEDLPVIYKQLTTAK